MTDQYEHIRAVKQAHQERLMRCANVVGVAIGRRKEGGKLTDEAVLVVMVTKKLPPDQLAPEDLLPTEIDGVRVDVQAVGEIRAQPRGGRV
jgi:hypothetical protein